MTNTYFQSYQDYFWQWEEQQTVISMPGGSTIAYAEFAAEVLKQLAPQGLPPFGSVLLGVIGTNPRADEAIEEIRRIMLAFLSACYKDAAVANDAQVRLLLDNALDFMRTLSRLPEAYRTGQKRLLALQAVFRNCHYKMALSSSRAQARSLAEGLMLKRTQVGQKLSKSVFNADFRVLALLNAKFPTPESIIDAMTGLPKITEELLLEQDTSPERTPEEFVEELIADSRTFPVGSLIRRLWSGLNIPVHSSMPGQQPLGGFSDLTNKGDFDKLLLSEFANDDLLFLTRLANNEALYIQREVPPENNKQERAILIDASLRSWGTPKLIAFATMLAVASHPKTTIACKAYVIGKRVHPIQIGSVKEIIDALQIVETGLHPAAGLEHFFKTYPASANREVFLITEPSALKQSTMLKVMHEHQALIHYLIYTDAEGRIDVYKKQQNSRKHVQQLLLPLGTLWQKPAPKKASSVKPEPAEAQAVENHFPILIKAPMNTRKLIDAPDGELFQITSDRLLLRFYEQSVQYYTKGWEIVKSRLPVAAGEFEIGLLDDGSYVLLLFDQQKKELFLMNLNGGGTKRLPFPVWRSKTPEFVFKEGAFLYTQGYGGKCWRIFPDGRLEETKPLGQALFSSRKMELHRLVSKAVSAGAPLRKVDRVFVNSGGRLVFNIHALRIHPDKYPTLDRTQDQTPHHAAARLQNNVFEFRDGSRVTIHHGGLASLRSSNPSIPEIYFPTMLDIMLGLATDTAFTGNKYYFCDPLYEVQLLKAGEQKLEMIRVVKNAGKQSLAAARDLVESAPGVVCRYAGEERARNVVKEIREAGGEAEPVRMKPGRQEQKMIPVQDFFDLYIQRFIDHIVAHGA